MVKRELKIENNIILKYYDKNDSVIIPDGIVEINEQAFKKLKKLISITFPKSIKKIKILVILFYISHNIQITNIEKLIEL